MKLIARLTAVTTLLLIPAVSWAAVFQDGGESFSLSSPVSDDFYVAGNHIMIGQPITGDLFSAGQMVEVSAHVSQDVYAAGEAVTVSGSVDDDLHAAGQQVEVTGNVAGDAFLAGQMVTVSGQVGKDVYAAGRVKVTSSATIAGDLRVFSDENPIIEEGAEIGGEVKFQVPKEDHRAGARRLLLVAWVRSVVSVFILALVMMYGARAFSRRVIEMGTQKKGKSFLTALVWLLLFIPVSILLAVTFVGLPIALAILALTVLFYLAGLGIAVAGIGRWVLSKLSKEPATELSWMAALTGAVVYKALQLVPIVGGIVSMVTVFISMGATMLTFFRIIRDYDKPDQNTSQNTGRSVGTPQ